MTPPAIEDSDRALHRWRAWARLPIDRFNEDDWLKAVRWLLETPPGEEP